MPIHTPATEIAYTQQKIEANFSNFSAWHQRSKVYELTGGLVLDREFNLVNQAMYTMPDDQSAWLYHRWLVSHCVSRRKNPCFFAHHHFLSHGPIHHQARNKSHRESIRRRTGQQM
jgi:hypothetical protein